MNRPSLTAVSTLLAAGSLVGALVFNGVQAHDSAVAQQQAKSATELSPLTQLQSAMNQSIYSRTRFANQFQELRLGERAALTPAAIVLYPKRPRTWITSRGFSIAGTSPLMAPTNSGAR